MVAAASSDVSTASAALVTLAGEGALGKTDRVAEAGAPDDGEGRAAATGAAGGEAEMGTA